MSSGPAPAYPPPTGAPVSFPATDRRARCSSPRPSRRAPSARWSVRRPRPTIPLNKLAPEAALRRLELTIVRRLEGFLHGDHLGLLPGPGSETADARIYVPGEDDVRRIDWAVTARTTQPHVRDTISDRELEVWALLDVTPSMNWGTEGVTKRDLGIAADRHHRLPQPEDGRPVRRLHHAAGRTCAGCRPGPAARPSTGCCAGC